MTQSTSAGSSLIVFLTNLCAATFGAMLVGILAMGIPAALIAILTRGASPGNFVDHVIDQPFFKWADKSNVLYLGAGLVLGFFSRRFSRSRWTAWVWVIPFIVLCSNLLTWKGAGPLNTPVYWKDVWDNYFGSDCGSSECMYEFLVTIPFYTSVLYSVGWVAAGYWGRQNL